MTTTRLRRLAVLSLGAVVVTAACGADPGSSNAESLAPPVIVRVAAGGDGAQLAGPMAEADDAAGREVSILPMFGGWIFVVGDGLPALPTNSVGYHFPAGAPADAAAVARIAAALGVPGEPQALDPDTGNAWLVGPEDGSAPALWVSNDGLVSWYYSAPWAGISGGGCGADDVASDGSSESDDAEVPVDEVPVEECTTPEPPANVPTAAEAEEKVRALLTSLGEDPQAFDLETYADEWGAYVTASTVADGVRWPVGFGFGFGAEGALQWANGMLGEPVATGPYPLIGLDEAVARLDEQNGMWGYRGVEMAGDGAVVDAPEGRPEDAGAEPVEVTLVSVSADLWWAWDADNSVWLLPAYTFTDADGLTFTVPAVADEYLIVVEPVVDPVPVPVDPPVDEAPPAGDITDLQGLVGVGVKEFEELAARFGFTTRVARQDGVDLAVTDDYSESRVNIAIEADMVVEVLSIG